MPAISIIIPSYNVERYFAQCLCSVRDQTFSDFEVICIDDVSIDETLRVGQGTAADDSRFRFLSQKTNDGQGAARNRALDLATGKYLLFLDADDYLDLCTLERLHAAAEADDLDDLYFSARTVYEDRGLEATHPEDFDNRMSATDVMTGADLLCRFVHENAFRPSACMHMVRRSLVAEQHLRFSERIIHEDLLWTMQVIALSKRARYLDEPFYQRRMRHGSTMTTERGIRNVKGLFGIAYYLDRWLEAHGAEYGDDFNEAWSYIVSDTLKDVAHDMTHFFRGGEDEIAALMEELDREERSYFIAHVLGYAEELDKVYMGFQTSHAFRTGDALMRVPRWVKRHL